jgi:fructose-bisphosphate aldolase class II
LVEGELGTVPTIDEKGVEAHAQLTSPELAVEFVKRTGVDFLAVSVGNLHGTRTKKPSLNTELIRTLAASLKVPIVLHGGDFLSNRELLMAMKAGIGKVNLGPEMRRAYVNGLRRGLLKIKNSFDHRPILEKARLNVERKGLARLSVLSEFRFS